MVQRSSPPGYYQANIAMRSIFWPADSVTEHTDVGEGRIIYVTPLWLPQYGTFRPSDTWDQRDHTEDTQGVSNQKSTEMCQSVWLPLVAHTTNPWRMAMFNTTGSLNQTLYPGRRRILLTTSWILILANPVSNQNHKVLCRAIGQGITQARGWSSEESEFMSVCFHAAV